MQHTEPIKKYLTMSKIYIYIYIEKKKRIIVLFYYNVHYDFGSDRNGKRHRLHPLMISFLPSFSSVLALFLLGHAFSFTLAAVKYRFLFIGFIKEFIYGK